MGFWEKKFDQKIYDKIDFFRNNIHNQELFDSAFSKIIKSMDLGENHEDETQENQKDSKNTF